MSFKKPTRGSVLVFSLIVLSIVLSAALSVAVVNVSNRKSAGSTAKSVQSFQVADSAVEMVLKEIYKGSRSNVSSLVSAISGASCNAASGSFTFPVSGGPSTAAVTFINNANGVISCTDNSATSTWRDDIVKIKVEGTASGTTRVIETAIAANQDYKVCFGKYATTATPPDLRMLETVVPSSWTNEICRAHVMSMRGGADAQYMLRCFFAGGTISTGILSTNNATAADAGIPSPNCGW